MSAIMKEIAAVTGVAQNRGEAVKDYAARLVRAVSDLSDDDWAKLSPESKLWFNDAADAVNTKPTALPIPPFPDAQAEPESGGRRRVSAEPAAALKDPEVGDEVKIVTKRDKVITGTITEMDAEVVVLNGDEEVSRDRIASIEVTKTAEGGTPAAQQQASPIEEPEVGDTIEAVTKRGKTKTGVVTAIEDGLIVIKDKEGEDELEIEKLESLKVTKKAKPARGAAAAPEEKKRTTKADNAGVSATVRMRELICDDTKATKEDIAKALKKENIQFNQSTLDLVYSDSHKLLKLLEERKMLK